MPESMTAVRLKRFGGLKALHVQQDVERPQPESGQLLIEVKATGVNPVDWKLAEGLGKGFLQPPYTVGCEVAGVVTEVGEGHRAFKPGDAVFAYVSLQRCGGMAPYAIALPEETASKPESLSFTEAAAIPVGALTSWQAMIGAAGLKAGQCVLIHGASGGVGSLAVQIAKARGAVVFGTASGDNADYVRQLGVDRFINYKEEQFDQVIRGVDVVYDCVGGDTQTRSFKVLKEGGALVSIVSEPPAKLAKQHKVTASMVAVQPNGSQLAEIGSMIDDGKLKPRVDQTFPLTEAPQALALSQQGKAKGKLVLLP